MCSSRFIHAKPAPVELAVSIEEMVDKLVQRYVRRGFDRGEDLNDGGTATFATQERWDARTKVA